MFAHRADGRAVASASVPPRPFAIDVPDAVLEDLRDRLARTRWPEPMDGAGWDYGADVDYVRDLCDHWRERYDWRHWERRLNEIPGFLCEVDGTEVHFWHLRGAGPAPMALLLLHGWPGSMAEFLELVGPLTDPAAHGCDPADAFDVVVPALPGFGFGGRPRDRGWGVSRIAAAFDTLMSEELGYSRYGVQGGDWGSFIAAKLGATFPERVAGIHVNFIGAPAPEHPGPEDADALERLRHWRRREAAYQQLQSTRPDSVTVAQSDSPAGLAAWVVEKFRRWSDCDGDVERAFARDVLLTNLMFYWAPNSTASAARIYYESAQDPGGIARRPRVEVPVGYAAFPHEIVRPPRHWVEPHYAIARWTEMPRGGHFAALEQPQLLLQDIRAFFRPLR
jgi:pimeloyl-ACP methyl ester carboxylesterase